jgi:hypothetical protein
VVDGFARITSEEFVPSICVLVVSKGAPLELNEGARVWLGT